MLKHSAPGRATIDSPLVIHRPRILIAEDETSVREFVDTVLRRAGYVTTRVMDGQEALELVTQCKGHFDLLLTDLVMPRMGGAALARELRRVDPQLKVLYFTGYRDRLFNEKAMLDGDEACLDKPATAGALLNAVAHLLKDRVETAHSVT
jgi:CheY-like chemotaxis protein